jgi:nucleotide-binding universal stress UspA family protein
MRAQIAAQADTINQGQIALARRHVEAAATKLERAGWRARGVVRTGQPLAALLAAVRGARADVLVLGARGAGVVTHFLLGSTAEAALKHAAVPVLIVR